MLVAVTLAGPGATLLGVVYRLLTDYFAFFAITRRTMIFETVSKMGLS